MSQPRSSKQERIDPLAIQGVFFWGLCLLGLLGCPSKNGQSHPPNVLLISIDTLRADRLGCYGSTLGLTPTIDRLAQEGVSFENAWCTAPLTLPSHASILTGLRPSAHGLRDNGPYPLSPDIPTLASRLTKVGFKCEAIVGAAPLDRRFGLDRGFERYDGDFRNRPGEPSFVERPGTDVARRAIDRLEAIAGQDRPFFLFVHFFDPHWPYQAPPRFAKGKPSQYEGEVAYVDYCVSQLLATLSRVGCEDDTLVILTADHGESLGAHGEKSHAHLLYDATLKVPLLIRLPGVLPAGRVVAAPVSIVDIFPTVIRLVTGTGIDTAASSTEHILDGIDLIPLIQSDGAGDGLGTRPVYAESLYGFFHYNWAVTRAIRIGNDKLIRSGEKTEIYDLAADPAESNDRSARDPAILATLQSLLTREAERIAQVSRFHHQVPGAAELRALGYVTGGHQAEHPSGPDRAFNDTLPAPCDRIEIVDLLNRAVSQKTVHPEEAIRFAQTACASDPQNPEAHFVHGSILRELANRRGAPGAPDPRLVEEAISALRQTLELRPYHFNALHLIGALAAFSSEGAQIAWIHQRLRDRITDGSAERETRYVLAFLIDLKNPGSLADSEKLRVVRGLFEDVVRMTPSGSEDLLGRRSREILAGLPSTRD